MNKNQNENARKKDKKVWNKSIRLPVLSLLLFLFVLFLLIPNRIPAFIRANVQPEHVSIVFPEQTPSPSSVPIKEESLGETVEEMDSPSVSDALSSSGIHVYGYTELKLNDDSEEVMKLQLRLMELGYLESDEPGTVFNEATSSAVSMFQRTLNSPITGIADSGMQEELFSDRAVTYEVRSGDYGSDIVSIQAVLEELGYYTGKLSGYYGTATEDAVEKFQDKNGLLVDGVINYNDREILLSNKVKPYIDLTPTPKPVSDRKPANKDSKSKNTPSPGSDSRESEKYPTGGTFHATGNVAGVISVAEAQIGKQYVTGDEGPNTFDCSGLIYYCLKTNGVSISRRSAASYSENDNWKLVSKMSDLKKGDLLFFKSDSSERVSHVGLFIGGSTMIDASSSNGKVMKRSCTSDYWTRNFVCARRVF